MHINFAFVKRLFLIFVLAGQFFLISANSYALTCQQVRQLVAVYLKMHYSYTQFDDELSRRTLDNFIKAWDSGKVYFLQADVDEFNKKYATKLDDMILSADCSAFDGIMKVYSKRFAEKQGIINKYIEAKHDFSIDEYMSIDRKKVNYAKTTEEISDRWRQRIKFQILQLKNTINDMPKVKKKIHPPGGVGQRADARNAPPARRPRGDRRAFRARLTSAVLPPAAPVITGRPGSAPKRECHGRQRIVRGRQVSRGFRAVGEADRPVPAPPARVDELRHSRWPDVATAPPPTAFRKFPNFHRCKDFVR